MSVYKITHETAEGCYIGSTTAKNPRTRFSTHKTHALYPEKYKAKMGEIMREHNRIGFIFECIESVEDKNILKQREQYYINSFKPAWNKIRAFRTHDERLTDEKKRQQRPKSVEYKKSWYEKNKKRILQKSKDKYINSTDEDRSKRNEYMRLYRSRLDKDITWLE